MLDWIIVILYLSLTASLGILANKYIHNISAYLIGGGKSGASINSATYIGSGLGLVTLMYASIDAFTHGFSYVSLAIIYVFLGGFLGISGLVISRLRKLNLLTIPEYFERRYNKKIRILAGTICALSGILNMGLFPVMGATFIAYSTNLGAGSVVVVNIITSILIVLVIAYTIVGGMVSVIITDYIQFVVLSIGMGLGVYFCLTHADLGWETMTSALAHHRGKQAFDPLAENGYGWEWVIYMTITIFFTLFCWAPEASRALTAKDPTTARHTFLLSTPALFARLAIPALWAIAAFTLVSQNAELTAHFFPDGLAGNAQHAAQAMPLALGKIVPTGLLGILVAGMMAAFMSTHDSYLLCWSSVITRDVIAPLNKKPMTDNQQIFAVRICIFIIGIFLLVWGIWYELPESVWSYMAVTATIYLSGAGIVLLGGLYWKNASIVGAYVTLLVGLIAITGIFLEPINNYLSGYFHHEILISSHQVGLATFFSCALAFTIFSLLFPDKEGRKERT